MQDPELSSQLSNRTFGWRAAGVFLLLGIFSVGTEGLLFPLWFSLAASAVALTVFRPEALEDPKAMWARIDDRFHRVVWPLVVGLTRYYLFAPARHASRRMRVRARQQS